MIRVGKHACEVYGTGVELLTELTLIVGNFKNLGIPQDFIKKAVEVGLETEIESLGKVVYADSGETIKDSVDKIIDFVERHKNAQKDKGATDTHEG